MKLTIALAGNPNSGKSTLFNALTGSNQYVGNWPGVTVEKKEGKYKKDKEIVVMDLPGVYSLSPYTLEEVVTRNYLIDNKPDVIVNIIDGSNLERNLYLTTQLVELSIPVVLAINMMDVVNKRGDKVNTDKLSKLIGCPVKTITALTNEGVDELMDLVVDTAKKEIITEPLHVFNGVAEHALAHIEEALKTKVMEKEQRWYAIKIFERDQKVLDKLSLNLDLVIHIEKDIINAEKELDDDSESIVTNARYSYISEIINSVYKKKNPGSLTNSDKIDRIVTNRWLGLPIFILVIWFVYWVSISTVGSLVTEFTNDVIFAQGLLPWATKAMSTSPVWLSGLVVDGIISGVGAVLGFVPQILLLFFLLAFLEQSGYMARIAFVLDRVFRKFGLSGKSFIPMLIGTGCSVPGIMASRTIENQRDRRMTIMTTSFMPCSAKLPIIAMLSGALFNNSGWIATSAYFLGILAIVISGIMLKKTKPFRGKPSPFVMEMPQYHMPTFKALFKSMWERGFSFIKKAGTLITVATILIWFAGSYSFGLQAVESYNGSILQSFGSLIAVFFQPLGFGNDWASVATVLGLVAKETIVATFGILAGIGEVAEDDPTLLGWVAVNMTQISAYSFLIFNLLCAPCFAAIGAIKQEMNDSRWTWFAIAYQTIFAYSISLIFYQFAMLFTGQGNLVGVFFASIVLAFMLYMILRPEPKIQEKEVLEYVG
jgi:ferrous iron transport protein B